LDSDVNHPIALLDAFAVRSTDTVIAKVQVNNGRKSIGAISPDSVYGCISVDPQQPLNIVRPLVELRQPSSFIYPNMAGRCQRPKSEMVKTATRGADTARRGPRRPQPRSPVNVRVARKPSTFSSIASLEFIERCRVRSHVRSLHAQANLPDEQETR
jgi:hypothetical protein